MISTLLGYIFIAKTLFASERPMMSHQQDTSHLSIVPIEAIHNPERGYHLESNYYVHNLQRPFRPYLTYPGGWFGDFNKRYKSESDKLSVMQLYLYLTAYVGMEIPEEAFENMQLLFDSAKENGYKFVLRFAYDIDYGSTDANYDDVFRHLDQLEPFIKKNIGLIDVWQMGFIGAWGEGHNSPMTDDYINKSRMVQRILDIFEDRQTTLRYPAQKDKYLLEQKYLDRMGYNNDYFTASEHPRAPHNDYTFNSPDYEQVKKRAPHVKIIGEIPYAEETEWGLHTLISVPNSLKILREHHYSLFDITQNTELNIENWKNTLATPALMDSIGILYDDSYFKENGLPVGRSVYDFVRDHLGYRLYIEKPLTTLQRTGNKLIYDIRIKNVGFSTIHNPRPLYLVLIDKDDQIICKEKLNDDPRTWQPYDINKEEITPLFHEVSGSIDIHTAGEVKIGLWLPDPESNLQYLSKYAIRFANDDMEIWKDNGHRYRVNIIDVL